MWTPATPRPRASQGRASADYTAFLKADALKGARIGVARDFFGADEEVDWVMESALDAMRRSGATTVDVRYPRWILDGKGEFYNAVRWPEFPVQIAQYLATTGPKYPKTLDELIARARQFTSTRDGGVVPNNPRWSLFVREQSSGSLDDPRYLAVRDHVLPAVRMVVEGMLAEQKLDAIVYPTSSRRPALLAGPRRPAEHALGHEHCEPDRLPGPHRACRLHEWRPARRHLFFRAGLQRGAAVGAGLRV